MTNKEWLILLTPIISNGIFIFCFQLWMKGKFNKLLEVDNRKKIIINKFIDMLKTSLELISLVEERFYNKQELKSYVDEFQASITMLINYGDSMEYIIGLTNELEQIDKNCIRLVKQVNYYETLEIGEVFTDELGEQRIILEYIIDNKEALKKLLNSAIEL